MKLETNATATGYLYRMCVTSFHIYFRQPDSKYVVKVLVTMCMHGLCSLQYGTTSIYIR